MQKSLFVLLVCAAFLLATLLDYKASTPTCAFVISLPHDRARLREFRRLYDSSDFAGVPLTVVEGVDGRRVKFEDFVASDAMKKLKKMVATGFRQDHPDLTPGAVGCYLSHMRVWEKVARCGHPYAFVFEDDAILDPHALEKFNRAVSRLPNGWDVVLLGHLTRGVEYCEGVLEVDEFWLLHAYAITPRAAQYLAGSMLPVEKQVDWAVSDMIHKIDLQVFALEPKLAMQNHTFRTNIQSPLLGR